MKIQLEVSRNRFSYFESPALYFSNKENFSIHIHIINNGDTPIAIPDPTANMNWQPTYTITGPSYPQGYTFSMRDILSKNSYIPVDPPSHKEKIPYITEIPPGTTHKANWNPGSILNFPQPGTHKLTLNLDWQGIKIQSNTATINIKPAILSSCQLIAEKNSSDALVDIDVLCLRSMDSNIDISKVNFSEDRDMMQMKFLSIFPYLSVEPEIHSFFSSWATSNRIRKRNGILNGKTLSTIDPDKKSSRIELDFEPALILPAVVSIEGKMDLFIINNIRNSLNMVRFSALEQESEKKIIDNITETANFSQTGEDINKLFREKLPISSKNTKPGDPAKRLWTIKLPHTPIYHRASIAPPGKEEKRGAVLVSSTDEGSVISVVRVAKEASEPEIQHLAVKDLKPVKDSVPAIYLTTNGELHASTILVSEPAVDKTIKIFLVNIIWDANNKVPVKIIQKEIAQTDSVPEALALSYAVRPENSPEPDWVILQANGQAKGNRSPNEFINLEDKPIRPLQLLSLEMGAFLLIEDKENVFDFQRLY